MTEVTLEHVNVTVTDPMATAERLCALFDWRIRWSGASKDDGFSVHVGGETSYLALYRGETPAAKGVVSSTGDSYLTVGGLNHIAVVVDDLDAMEARVAAAGYEPRAHADYEPGRRFYFFGEDGIEFEIVSYAPKD